MFETYNIGKYYCLIEAYKYSLYDTLLSEKPYVVPWEARIPESQNIHIQSHLSFLPREHSSEHVDCGARL